jgi:hypothetical protein
MMRSALHGDGVGYGDCGGGSGNSDSDGNIVCVGLCGTLAPLCPPLFHPPIAQASW